MWVINYGENENWIGLNLFSGERDDVESLLNEYMYIRKIVVFAEIV